MINNAPMVFAIGTQEEIITFLSNWVKDSKLKMFIFVDFRSCLQCGRLLSGNNFVPDGRVV